MAGAWIELIERDGERRRVELRRGLTVIGGAKADVPVEGVEGDQLHVWDQPPKLIFVGFGAPPECEGRAVEERELRSGDVVTWRGRRLEFGGLMNALIEEIPLAPSTPPARDPPRAAPSAAQSWGPSPQAPAALPQAPASLGVDELYWRRLKAGLAVELGVADPAVARRWQDAILHGEFDADACARDVLSAAPALTDLKLGERSTRLQRDLVMAPVASSARGGVRKLKGAAQSTAAMIVAQFVVLSISLLLVMVALFVVRLRWQWSVDGFFDRVSGLFSG